MLSSGLERSEENRRKSIYETTASRCAAELGSPHQYRADQSAMSVRIRSRMKRSLLKRCPHFLMARALSERNTEKRCRSFDPLVSPHHTRALVVNPVNMLTAIRQA